MPKNTFTDQLRNLRKMETWAIECFKRNNFDQALNLFTDCLDKRHKLINNDNLNRSNHATKLAQISQHIAFCYYSKACNIADTRSNRYFDYLYQAGQYYYTSFDDAPVDSYESLYFGAIALKEAFVAGRKEQTYQWLIDYYENLKTIFDANADRNSRYCAPEVKVALKQCLVIFAHISSDRQQHELARQASVKGIQTKIDANDRRAYQSLQSIEDTIDSLDAQCYLNWGSSLFFQIMAGKRPPTDILMVRDILHKADKKADEVSSDIKGDIYNTLASTYNDPAYAGHSPILAFYYYKLAAENGFQSAYYKVAIKYYKGEGVGPNYQQAFHWFKIAADNGDQAAKLMMADCYRVGAGTKMNLKQALELLSLKPGRTRVERLLTVLVLYDLDRANRFPSNYSKNEVVETIKQINDGLTVANLLLGEIFRQGLLGQKRDLLSAEHYFLEAMRAGHKEAGEHLLQVYRDMLDGNDQLLNSQNVKEAIQQLLINVFQFSYNEAQKPLDDIIDEIDRTRKQFSIAINQDIVNSADQRSLSPKDKITTVLASQCELANSINVATSIHRIGQISEQIDYGGHDFFVGLSRLEYGDSFYKLLDRCQYFMDKRELSLRSLASVISGLSRLYKHYYSERVTDLLVRALDVMANQNPDNLDISLWNTLLASFVRSPLLSHHRLALSLLVLNNNSALIQNVDNNLGDLSNVSYHLMVLDNLWRSMDMPENLEVNWQAHAHRAVKALFNPDTLLRHQYSQYCLIFLYLECYRPESVQGIGHDLDYISELARSGLPMEQNVVTPSELQKKVTTYMQNSLNLKQSSEQKINGLPVDIYLAHHHTIVQVDGPHHYRYKNREQNRETSLKDRFHDAILQCPGKNRTVRPDYTIVHIDYMALNEHGMKHVDAQLRKANVLKKINTGLSLFGHQKQEQSSKYVQSSHYPSPAFDHANKG